MWLVTVDDLDDVVRRERALLDPAIRADAEAAGRLLHPNFLEFGKSGRVWDREGILAALAADPSVSGPVTGLIPDLLSDDVVLLTYRSADGTLRSSVWVRDAGFGWRLRFHQGTLGDARVPTR